MSVYLSILYLRFSIFLWYVCLSLCDSWDGKEEPRLLERTVSESSSSKTYVPITEYSWADGKKSVTIYIDYDEAMTVSTDTLVVETNTESFVFTFTGVDNKDYKLLIDKLSNEIESGIVKQKEGQFRILLKKKEETTWFSLKKT